MSVPAGKYGLTYAFAYSQGGQFRERLIAQFREESIGEACGIGEEHLIDTRCIWERRAGDHLDAEDRGGAGLPLRLPGHRDR